MAVRLPSGVTDADGIAPVGGWWARCSHTGGRAAVRLWPPTTAPEWAGWYAPVARLAALWLHYRPAEIAGR